MITGDHSVLLPGTGDRVPGTRYQGRSGPGTGAMVVQYCSYIAHTGKSIDLFIRRSYTLLQGYRVPANGGVPGHTTTAMVLDGAGVYLR